MQASRLNQDQLEQMARLRESGWGIKRLADLFTQQGTPISKSGIEWQCMRMGADLPARFRIRMTAASEPFYRGGHLYRPWTEAEDARLFRLEANGTPVNEIARIIERGRSSVRARLMTLARRDARAEDAV